MTPRLVRWLVAAALYGLFLAWYSGLRGPLADAEVDAWVALATEQGMDPQTIRALEPFFRWDTGRPFLMVNAIDMTETPPAVEGAPAGADAEQLMGLYMEHMYGELLRRACHPVTLGEAVHPAIDLVGIDGAEEWTMGALFRYRSRRDFMAIVSHPEMGERHRFKVAALDKTIAYPIEAGLDLGDLRVLVGLLLLAVTAVVDGALARRGSPSRS